MGAKTKGAISQRAMASNAGVTVRTLQNWEKEGIDITDSAAVLARASHVDKRAASNEDMAEVKLRKLRAEADLKEHDLQVQKGLFVSSEAELAAGQKAGLAIMGAFLKMSSDLTPMLAGRPAGEVKKILDKYARDKLNELSSYDPKLSILLG